MTTLSNVFSPPRAHGMMWQTSFGVNCQSHSAHLSSISPLTNLLKVALSPFEFSPTNRGCPAPRIAIDLCACQHVTEQYFFRAARQLSNECLHVGQKFVTRVVATLLVKISGCWLCHFARHSIEQNLCADIFDEYPVIISLQNPHGLLRVFAAFRHSSEQYLNVFARDGKISTSI